MAYTNSVGPDQPAPQCCLLFAESKNTICTLVPQRKPWSDCVQAQADRSLHCLHIWHITKVPFPRNQTYFLFDGIQYGKKHLSAKGTTVPHPKMLSLYYISVYCGRARSAWCETLSGPGPRFHPRFLKWTHQDLNLGHSIDQKRGVSQKKYVENGKHHRSWWNDSCRSHLICIYAVCKYPLKRC